MKTRNNRLLALTAIVVAAVTFVAWKSAGHEESYHFSTTCNDTDTLPVRKKYNGRRDHKIDKIGDLDEAMRDIDRAMADLDKDLKIDLSSIDKQVKEAMDQVAKVDFKKINIDINNALKEIDWENIGREVKRALNDAEKEIKNIDKDALRSNIDNAKQHIEINNDLIKGSISLGLEAAKLGLRAAKKEIQLLKDFTNELDKDGLIDKKGAYRLRIKDNELYIDGKKQSKEVNEKYRKYFRDGNYTISNDGKDDNDDDRS